MILLDEPSMGLAPQIVEEIFEIVKNLNTAQKVSFLPRRAEHHGGAALRRLRLHPGERRVVLEGAAKSLSENEDVKEFYLGISSGGRRSFRETKNYRRRKRWLA
jgi:branched-chain amino acid transport system ATP-binding protein